MLDPELAAGLGECLGAVAGAVIGEEPANADTQALLVAHGRAQVVDRGAFAFRGMEFTEGNA